MTEETFHRDFIEVETAGTDQETGGQDGSVDAITGQKRQKVKIKNLIDGTILVREDTRKLLPYILFLTFLGIIYIGNRFHAEKVIRQINEVKAEVGNLRAEQITTTAELMNISRPSEVVELIRQKNLGLVESIEPPKKLEKK